MKEFPLPGQLIGGYTDPPAAYPKSYRTFPEGFLHLRRPELRPELCPYLCVCVGDLAAAQPLHSGGGSSVDV